MKKKFIERIWVLEIPLYGYNVTIHVTNDFAKCVKNHEYQIMHDVDEARALHIRNDSEPESVLMFGLDATINDISHECMHVTQKMVDWLSLRYDDREAIAYLNAHITQGVYEFVRLVQKRLDKRRKV